MAAAIIALVLAYPWDQGRLFWALHMGREPRGLPCGGFNAFWLDLRGWP